ncbi:unnamed protein product [Linum tenue]|uniref:Uncharacterized protein n=1 Tax=Linum tenue TaxID=586396 RepID=A0AAV0IB43_9ROSI|nr:unnamed protein product [Linum tenue]
MKLFVRLANGVLDWLLLVKYGRKLKLNTLQWIPCNLLIDICSSCDT